MDDAIEIPHTLGAAATRRSARARFELAGPPRAADLLDALPFAVVAVTGRLAVTATNREAARMLGLVAGSHGPLPEPWAEFSLRRFARERCANGAVPAEVRAQVSDGRVLELTGVPRDGGAVLTLRDVTAQAHQEQADRAFVANAAHELRAALAGISSAAEALELGAKNDPIQRDQLVGGIVREVRTLRREVEALLVLARAHAEPRALLLANVAVAPLVEQVAQSLTVDAGVAVETACEPHVTVRAMRPLLEVALRNVARNASRHTRHGRIRISCRRVDDRVVVEVADDGPGIEPEVRTRLFERFAAGSDGDGFGIGLPLTREILRLLGGDVEVESHGPGTTVRLVLPAA